MNSIDDPDLRTAGERAGGIDTPGNAPADDARAERREPRDAGADVRPGDAEHREHAGPLRRVADALLGDRRSDEDIHTEQHDTEQHDTGHSVGNADAARDRGAVQQAPDRRDPDVEFHADPAQNVAAESGAEHRPDHDDEARATLIPHGRSAEYHDRWEALKGGFVDEPRTAVRRADELVGEVLDELGELFRRQRAELERDLHDDRASTEDLRIALGRYRSFFDRLLSL